MQGCGGEEQRKEREKKKKDALLKTIFNHSLICQFQLIIISITLQSILIQSLSLVVDENTNTHTQLINIYHTNHHQSISSTTTIHVHSFSFHKQHTQSLSKTIISLLNPQNQSLPPFSLIHLIQFNNVIQLIPFPHSSLSHN